MPPASEDKAYDRSCQRAYRNDCDGSFRSQKKGHLRDYEQQNDSSDQAHAGPARDFLE